MNDKKKIVLGSEDIKTKGISDIFININLQKTFNQIKEDKYDNNFDLSEQFRKERNLSRNFRIYGIVDSNIIDTDNLLIEIYKDSGLTLFHTTITTSSLVYEEKNVFNKKRGKYLLELDNYDSDFTYIKIIGDNFTYDDQIFEQQLVFHNIDGDFVEYGTNTVDVGFNSLGFLEIENDFPFFYNKHWIKKDIQIIESKQSIVNFTTQSSSVDEGNSTEITISLDKPSPFGNEVLDLDYQLITAKSSDFSVSLSGTTITFPITLSWNANEQSKTLTFNGLNDDFQEFSESLFLEMKNFQFVDSGKTIVHNININNTTPRHYANYNFGELYRNRYVFTGRTYLIQTFNPIIKNTNSFSILRNGLKYERKNEEFYPNDTYTISIENKGNNTILPINTSIGVSKEELFLSNEIKNYNLSTQYSGVQVQKLKVIFSNSGTNLGNSNAGSININGINFNVAGGINYNSAKLAFTTQNPLTAQNLETPWSFEFEDANKIITITSKSPGVPIDFSTIEVSGPFSRPIDPSKIPIIEEIDDFVFYEQIPLVLKLAANSNSNNSCLYEIVINKIGFGGVVIPSSLIPATSTGTNNFLITGLDFVMRDWDDNIQNCTFITGTTVDTNLANSQTWQIQNVTPNTLNFIMPIGKAYINGTILYSSNNLPGKQNNESNYLSAAFYPKKLLIEPCTDDPTVNFSLAQKTLLTIPGIGLLNSPIKKALLQNNANGRRSFDFRTGTTGTYTTLSHTNSSFNTSDDWKWKSNVMVSGGAFGGTNGQMSKILDYGDLSLNIQIGPVEGQDINGNRLSINSLDSTIYLESKTPGIPFDITNIVNAFVHTSASNMFNESVTAGDILGPIKTQLIVPSLASGDSNPARNFLGGFNPILQLVP